jgi:hypothetical protein
VDPAAVMAGQRGPDDGDGRANDVVPGSGRDGWAAWSQ